MKQAHAVFAAVTTPTNNSTATTNGYNLITNGKHSSTTPHSLNGKEMNNNGNNVVVPATTPNNATANTNSTNGLNLTQFGHFNQISEVKFCFQKIDVF